MTRRTDTPIPESSDPNNRPLRVITFLAAHPHEAFSLADIARFLGLSKGSAHRVMTTLSEAGYVSRHPRHKTYTLGLALVAIGQAALERYPGIAVARREMARLAEELGVGCGAAAVVGGEYILLAREGAAHAYDGMTLVGERRFVVPAIGIGQMAWRSAAEIERYLDSGAAYLSPAARHHLAASLPIIRQRGYSMAANGIGLRRLIENTVIPIAPHAAPAPSLDALARSAEIALEEFQLLAPADAGAKGLAYIGAPVFSADGEVAFEIHMAGLPLGLSEAQFERHAGRLLLAADIVTNAIRGRKPPPW